MKLSICVITYNHSEFIKQCLEGALNQKFEFDYEIVISDDCSNDDTVLICRQYQENNPDLITLLTSERNNGMAFNWYKAIQACSGEFIAICEGDDYWISENKVMTQFDYMSENPNCNLCFHDVEITGSSKPQNFYFFPSDKDILSFKDVILNHQIPTCSMMIRRDAFMNKIPKIFYKFPVCDIPVHLILTERGYAFHIREKFSVYRVNEFSITNNKNRNSFRYMRLIKMYFSLLLVFNFKYIHIFLYKIIRSFVGYVKESIFKIW